MLGQAWRAGIRLLTFGCWLVVSSVCVELRAEQFPYVAYVSTADSLVRSGPAEQHYPTQKLPTGYAVEVYRHDGSHWCAIRPPAGEYCLVAADAVRLLADQTAEVVKPQAVARIGSKLTSSTNAVQVLLTPGEVVEVITPPKPADPWIQIAPPAGEFRWIAAEQIRRQPPVETAAGGQLSSTLGAGHRWQATGVGDQRPSEDPDNRFDHLNDAAVTPTEHQTPAEGAATGTSSDATSADEPIEIIPGSPADNGRAPASLSEANGAAQALPSPSDQPSSEQVTIPAAALADVAGQTGTGSPDAEPVPSPGPTGSAPPRMKFPGEPVSLPVNRRVAELQFQLSQTVAETPTEWNLTSVRAETAALLAQEQDPQARLQLRDLLDRIAVFEQVQRRYLDPPIYLADASPRTSPLDASRASTPELPIADQFTDLPGGEAPLFTGETKTVRSRIASDASQGMIGPVREIVPTVDETATPTPDTRPTGASEESAIQDDPFEEGEAKYDAVGTLKPVVSRRANAPRYALVDDRGDVSAFVSAAPDVNLSRDVGRRIGVHGARGFMPDYRRSHVTATRVRTIGETTLR